MRAEGGDVVGTVGQAAKAFIETAHALECRRRRWVLNEKKVVEQAGLRGLHARFVGVPASTPELVTWVDELRAAIGQARA